MPANRTQLILLATLLLALGTEGAIPNEPDTIRGLTWGTPKAQVENLEFVATAGSPEAIIYKKSQDKLSVNLGTVTVPLTEVYYLFNKGQFSGISMVFEGMMNYAMTATGAISATAFGTPSNVDVATPSYTWRGNAIDIYLTFNMQSGFGTLNLFLKSLSAETVAFFVNVGCKRLSNSGATPPDFAQSGVSIDKSGSPISGVDVPPSAQASKATGKWRAWQSVDAFSDRVYQSLELDADQPIITSAGIVTPKMHIQVSQKQLALFLSVGAVLDPTPGGISGFLSGAPSILVRFDSEKPHAYEVLESKQFQSLQFFRSRAIIEKMLAHKRVTVEIPLFVGSDKVVTFDLGGLSEAIKPIEDQLGNKFKPTK